MDEQDGDVPRDDVARRAYEISQGEGAGTPEENWHRAERELRKSPPASAAPKRTRTKKKSEDPVGS